MHFDAALFVFWYLAFLLSITLHEAAHALAALWLGDPTAYHSGQVTLSPWPHIRRSPVGTILFPVLSFLWMGWMMGWASAPYDPLWAVRHPRRAAWMALAGPLANLLLVVLAGLLIRAGMWCDVLMPPGRVYFAQVVAAVADEPFYQNLATFLSILFSLNVLLLVFNLLPLPPLDGGAVLMLAMDEATARRYIQSFLWQPYVQVFGLLIAWRVLAPLLLPILLAAVQVLYPGVRYAL